MMILDPLKGIIRWLICLINILKVFENVTLYGFLLMEPISYTVTNGGDLIESPSFDSCVMEKRCVSISIIDAVCS